MTQEVLLRGLQDAVKAAVAASIVPNWETEKRIAFIGVGFALPADGKYLEVIDLPADGGWEAWGPQHQQLGALRLILHWPQGAPYEPKRVLESIVSYFTKDRRFAAFKVAAVPSFSGVLAQGSENLYPVTVRYQRFNN